MRRTVEELQVTNNILGSRSAESGGGGGEDDCAVGGNSPNAHAPCKAAAVNGDKRASPESDFGLGKGDEPL